VRAIIVPTDAHLQRSSGLELLGYPKQHTRKFSIGQEEILPHCLHRIKRVDSELYSPGWLHVAASWVKNPDR